MDDRYLATAVGRERIGADGRSGSRLERVSLSDGNTLVVKRMSPRYDRVAQATMDDGREPRLFHSGVLDRLPPGAGHAIVDAWWEDDEWVIVMRDVSSGLIPNEHIATRPEVERALGALTALHRAYAPGPRLDGLCPLPAMLSHLFPATMAAVRVRDEFPETVVRGWEIFHDIVPVDVSTGVHLMHGAPSELAARLGRFPTTFLHGDFWLVNCSILPSKVVFFDWGLATWGPPAVDVSVFLAGHGSRMEPTREEVLSRFAELSGSLHHPEATRLALSHGLALMGWNKALDAVEHPDPAVRDRERADLDWWISRFDPS